MTTLAMVPSLISVLTPPDARWVCTDGVRMSTQYSALSRGDHMGPSPSSARVSLMQRTSTGGAAGAGLPDIAIVVASPAAAWEMPRAVAISAALRLQARAPPRRDAGPVTDRAPIGRPS